MSLRTHAVVVQPDQWSGGTAELARLLAPITGTDVAPLTEALSRGPMTVEADLSAADAQALHDRLSSMGVPAEIQPAAAGPQAGAVPGAITVDRARVTDEVPRTRRSTMVGHKPMVTDEVAEEDGGGWGAVFPDLAKRAPPKPAAPPSLDDLEGQRPRRRKSETEPLRGLTDELPEATPPLKLPDPEAPPVAPKPTPPPPQPTSTGRSTKAPIKPSGFDASKLAALMPDDDGDRAPFKPTGFDPRPPHHPPFASMFAILAPGAGHVFNGDDDDAVAIALRFWMIAPWVRSVREARERAEKIRDFWAPRPEDGSGFRAFKFVGAFWLCVGLVVGSLAFGVPAVVHKLTTRPPEPDPSVGVERLESAHRSARTGVLGARVKALDALGEASKDLVPEPKFTLSDEERAERLFAIGYVECRRHTFSMCEAMMKRVLQLRPGYGPAFKLQAWASVSARGRREKMPDVGPVPTLDEIELNKMREEMILDGERVPPPRDPNPAADTADAGSPTTADAGAAP